MNGGSIVPYVERPVYFPAGADTLFGILTLPADREARTGLIMLVGAGSPLTTNRNRLSVRICREIAALGYAGFRMDYHGLGESTGSVDGFRLDRPFVDDVAAAVKYLESQGVDRVVLAGSCFGARTALSAAATLDNVDAVILMASAVRDYALGELKGLNVARSWSLGRYLRALMKPGTVKGLFEKRKRRAYGRYARTKLRVMLARIPGVRKAVASKPTSTEEVSPSFEQPLRDIVQRGVAVEFFYGTQDKLFDHEFQPAAAGPLADLLDGRNGSVRLTVLPGRVHGFTSVEVQDAVVDAIVAWVASRQPDQERATVGEPS
jgi:dienelactone hydrolase